MHSLDSPIGFISRNIYPGHLRDVKRFHRVCTRCTKANTVRIRVKYTVWSWFYYEDVFQIWNNIPSAMVPVAHTGSNVIRYFCVWISMYFEGKSTAKNSPGNYVCGQVHYGPIGFGYGKINLHKFNVSFENWALIFRTNSLFHKR